MFEVQHLAPRSTRWWYSRRDEIDMEPDYQRAGQIWAAEDKRYLIDTILNDYDIPKIYVADFTTIKSPLNISKKRYAVIDGKQRLEAIFDFLSDNLSLSRKIIFSENHNLNLAGLRFSDLQSRYPEIASRVEDFPLTVVHVVTDEQSRVNELFVRLNKGASLTGAEVRNAMVGPLPRLIREVSNHEFFKEFTKFQTKRGQHRNAVAKLFLFEINNEIRDTKRVDLDKLVRDSEEESPSAYAEPHARIEKSLNRMCDVFKPQDELLAAQGNLPVFYWFIKGVSNSKLKHVRSFLVEFTNSIRENGRLEDSNKNPILSAYSFAARSTNDAKSIERRIDILNDYFRMYL
jgi:hypothetical protein